MWVYLSSAPWLPSHLGEELMLLPQNRPGLHHFRLPPVSTVLYTRLCFFLDFKCTLSSRQPLLSDVRRPVLSGTFRASFSSPIERFLLWNRCLSLAPDPRIPCSFFCFILWWHLSLRGTCLRGYCLLPQKRGLCLLVTAVSQLCSAMSLLRSIYQMAATTKVKIRKWGHHFESWKV